MNNRLTISLLLLVVAIGGAVMATRSRSGSTELAAPEASLPKVEAADVDGLTIARPGKPTLRFDKADGRWRMLEPVAAEADQDAVEAAVNKLSELEVSGSITSNSSLHARLEVADGKGVRVSASKGGEAIADIWLGANKNSGTMARAEGSDDVVAVRGTVRYPYEKETRLYRNRVITDVETDAVATARFESSKGTFAFSRQPDGEWQQAEGETPIEKFDPAKVKALVSTFSRLQAADFAAPGASPEATGLAAPQGTLTLSTTGDSPTETRLRLGANGGKEGQWYVQLEGRDTIYLVAKYNGEQMQADASAFEKSDTPPPGVAPPGGFGGAPPMGMGGGGGQQLPPELMQQIQRQLAQQQQQQQQR